MKKAYIDYIFCTKINLSSNFLFFFHSLFEVPSHIQRKWNQYFRENNYTPLFIAALFTIVKIWDHPACWSCSSTDEYIKKMWCIHNKILFSLLKTNKQTGNPIICINMNEPGGYDIKWDKPRTERQIPSVPT